MMWSLLPVSSPAWKPVNGRELVRQREFVVELDVFLVDKRGSSQKTEEREWNGSHSESGVN